jgi:hypothetical protein
MQRIAEPRRRTVNKRVPATPQKPTDTVDLLDDLLPGLVTPTIE